MPLAVPSPALRASRFRPRAERDADRIRGVATATAQPAVAVALLQIEAAFGEAAAVNDFKLRVERYLRLGPRHPAIRARFAARTAMLRGRSLDGAIAVVECWWRDERKAFQIASAFGRGGRLPLEVLSELRLILRLARFRRAEADYQAALAEMGGDTVMLQAAE